MRKLTVQIPDPELAAFVRELVANGPYRNSGDYVASLIEADRLQRAKARLQAMLREGLREKPVEVTDNDWENLAQQCEGRQARRKRG